MIRLHNQDCMEAMKSAPDDFWDLGIVDPPYGMKRLGAQSGGIKSTSHRAYHHQAIDKWDQPPTKEYFELLRRKTKNQIVWGGQYFTDKLPLSRCWICWDKVQFMPTYSKIELAWTSFKLQTEIFKYRNIDSPGFKIHPTQKPIALYEWLLSKYAKKGFTILDTHLGSGSSAIAAHRMGFEFDGYEIDRDYFEGAENRLREEQKQLLLFGSR